MGTDRTIASIAAGQHAAVGRRQLLDAGVPAHAIDHRLTKGLLVRAHAGVYLVAGAPVTWHQRIMAATLAGGPGAVASHRAAGYLHGLAGIEPLVEISVGRARAPRATNVVIHRLGHLSPADVEVRDGIPRTCPPATILGLAGIVPVRLLESALDDALVRGILSSAQLQRRLDASRARGRPGIAALSELLASAWRHRATGITRAGWPGPGTRSVPVPWSRWAGASSR